MPRITDEGMKQRLNASFGGGRGAVEMLAVLTSLRDDLSAMEVYAADGPIIVQTHVAVLTKGSALALTLPVPSAEQNGARIAFVKVSNFNHTITVAAANTIVDAFTGGVGNRLTLTSSPGLTSELFSYDGKWYCSTANGGSITAV